jgi:hypothetical protein
MLIILTYLAAIWSGTFVPEQRFEPLGRAPDFQGLGSSSQSKSGILKDSEQILA